MTEREHQGWRARLVDDHDYLWARLPFIVPMALAIARRRGDAGARAIARDVLALRTIVLDHLSREEQALVRQTARTIRDRLHDDHLAVASLLASLREEVARKPADDATERALFAELARLDARLVAQIPAEEQLLELA
jgi:hypothetical protein